MFETVLDFARRTTTTRSANSRSESVAAVMQRVKGVVLRIGADSEHRTQLFESPVRTIIVDDVDQLRRDLVLVFTNDDR